VDSTQVTRSVLSRPVQELSSPTRGYRGYQRRLRSPGGFESSATSIGPAISLISVELFTTPAWMRATLVATKLGLADDVIRAATVNDGDGSGKAMVRPLPGFGLGLTLPESDTGPGAASRIPLGACLFAPCRTMMDSMTCLSVLGMVEASAFFRCCVGEYVGRSPGPACRGRPQGR